jgi:hypothetical protein
MIFIIIVFKSIINTSEYIYGRPIDQQFQPLGARSGVTWIYIGISDISILYLTYNA